MKCGCRRKQRKCGPGFLCQRCANTDENDKCDGKSSEDEGSDFEDDESEVFEPIDYILRSF